MQPKNRGQQRFYRDAELAVGAERGRSRISNKYIYILLPCRFFIVISNGSKQIGKRIEVSKDFTVTRNWQWGRSGGGHVFLINIYIYCCPVDFS